MGLGYVRLIMSITDESSKNTINIPEARGYNTGLCVSVDDQLGEQERKAVHSYAQSLGAAWFI